MGLSIKGISYQPRHDPGPRLFVRLQVLVRPRLRRLFDRRITRKLNALLADAMATARRRFHGPITYAAGGWEKVDWSGFDIPRLPRPLSVEYAVGACVSGGSRHRRRARRLPTRQAVR